MQGGGGVRGEMDVMGPPMLVTYRLQGLDGEATERMIEHLVEPAAEQQEPEQEFSVARVLADQGPSGLALPFCLTEGVVLRRMVDYLLEQTHCLAQLSRNRAHSMVLLRHAA